MNVRCAKCVVEYDFRADSFPDGGLQVECGTCGHRFRLFEDGPRESEWRVRVPNGTLETFHELATLKRWIVEKRLVPEAELSTMGEPWVRLSEVPGLANLFGIVDSAEDKEIQSVRGVESTGSAWGRALRFMGTLCVGGVLVLGGILVAEFQRGELFERPEPGAVVIRAVVAPVPAIEAKSVPPSVIPAIPKPEEKKVVKREIRVRPSSERGAAVAPPKKMEIAGRFRLMARANLLREQERPLAALGVYRKILRMDEGNLDARMGMGWSLFDLNRYEQSREVFRGVLQQFPKLSDAHIGLAEVYRVEGKTDLAKLHFQEYLAIVPHGAAVSMVKGILEKLK